MLSVNNSFYSAENFEAMQQSFRNIRAISAEHPQRIAVCLEDTFSWLALCFYLKDAQHSVMPIHPATPQDAAKNLATRAGCTLLFFQTLDEAIQLDANPNVAAITRESSGLIQMSSGTTGEPKCIERSWQSIDKEIATYIQFFTEPESMTPIVACPVTHSYGLICGVMVALARGKAPLIVTNINPRYLIKTLQAAEAPLLYASPSLLQGMMRLWPADEKLHAIMTSGTLMTQATFDELRPRITHIFQQYGCSEAGCISINKNLLRPDDLGEPLPHLQLNSGTNQDAPAEITVTPKGESSAVHTQDLGYLQTGDDGKQHLHFISRLDDTIIVSGLNVYPQDVENTLLTHPQIDDVVVFKTDDVFAGQRVCVRYVANSPIEPHDVRSWCLEHMASFQVPSLLEEVSEIERMPNGKISRKKVAQEFLAQQKEASHA